MNRENIHRTHGIVAFVLFLVGSYLYYQRGLYGPPLLGLELDATLIGIAVIMFGLFGIHEHYGL